MEKLIRIKQKEKACGWLKREECALIIAKDKEWEDEFDEYLDEKYEGVELHNGLYKPYSHILYNLAQELYEEEYNDYVDEVIAPMIFDELGKEPSTLYDFDLEYKEIKNVYKGGIFKKEFYPNEEDCNSKIKELSDKGINYYCDKVDVELENGKTVEMWMIDYEDYNGDEEIKNWSYK